MRSHQKQQKKQSQNQSNNRQQKKHELVAQAHQRNKQSGEYQTINDIFSRLPLPRLEKNGYKFLFKNIKQNVESTLDEENKIQELQKIQQQFIDNIQVELEKLPKIDSNQGQNKQGERQYDDGQSSLLEKGLKLKFDDITNQTLPSTKPIHKAIQYLRNQKTMAIQRKNRVGEDKPFLQDILFVVLDQIQKQIPNIKIFLQQINYLKKHSFEFINENQMIFQEELYPSIKEIQIRASCLAKLYLLNLYNEQNRKYMELDVKNQADLKKQIMTKQIKQTKQYEKQGEHVEDADLLQQAKKIKQWIQMRMNSQAYQQFKGKNGERSAAIKKSLEKLVMEYDAQANPTNKLKLLIKYKYSKGW